MIKNKFAKWIEWLLDLLPLFAILFSCLYVTFNKNAYQSYSGDTSQQVELQNIDSFDTLEIGYRYRFVSSNSETINNLAKQLVVENVNIINISTTNQTFITDLTNSTSFSTTWYSNTAYLIPIVDGVAKPSLDLNSNSIIFDFDLVGYSRLSNYSFSQLYDAFIYKVVTYDNEYLNNAFTYALSQFNDLGFDKLNFINWFTGLFLNGTSNVYTTFINGYLNYFLLVECTYVLPMVLYWFIHLGERLINKLEYGGDK